MINGLEIVQRIYQRLRQPDDTTLPYKTVLQTVSEIVAMKKIDLAISEQNNIAEVSSWFTPLGNDTELDIDDVFLPIRLERRPADSSAETGVSVPLVNYQVLNTSLNGAAAFYGDPLRLAFRDSTDFVSGQQYRLIYESDFLGDISLENNVSLPTLFKGMVAVEACYQLLEVIEDTSPEWIAFVALVAQKWREELAMWEDKWRRYVRKFRGTAQIPKRKFINRGCGVRRTVWFQESGY